MKRALHGFGGMPITTVPSDELIAGMGILACRCGKLLEHAPYMDVWDCNACKVHFDSSKIAAHLRLREVKWHQFAALNVSLSAA